MAEQRIIPISEIRLDGGTQMRVALNDAVVADYTQLVKDCVDLDPIVVFYDGKNTWPGDGFHRIAGYRAAGAFEIDATVYDGTQRDAILYAVGANARHGLHRSPADKRKAVQTLLADAEWSKWSQMEIAKACAVSQPFVSRLIAEMGASASYAENKTKEAVRDGKAYQIDTTNIGKGRPASHKTDEAKAAQQAQQAEHDRQREEAKARLPEAVQHSNAARQAAIEAKRNAPTAADDGGDDRVDEMEQTIRHMQESIDALQADSRKFETMRVQWEQGGFEKVIADKDENIRVLNEQLRVESADKASWAKTAKKVLKLLQEKGHAKDIVIDAKTGEMRNG